MEPRLARHRVTEAADRNRPPFPRVALDRNPGNALRQISLILVRELGDVFCNNRIHRTTESRFMLGAASSDWQKPVTTISPTAGSSPGAACAWATAGVASAVPATSASLISDDREAFLRMPTPWNALWCRF